MAEKKIANLPHLHNQKPHDSYHGSRRFIHAQTLLERRSLAVPPTRGLMPVEKASLRDQQVDERKLPFTLLETALICSIYIWSASVMIGLIFWLLKPLVDGGAKQ